MADEQVQAPLPEEKAPAPEAPVNVVQALRMGATVHYVYGNSPVLASILEVYEDGSVRLQAHDNGFSASPIFYDAGGAEGTFHYPEE